MKVATTDAAVPIYNMEVVEFALQTTQLLPLDLYEMSLIIVHARGRLQIDTFVESRREILISLLK